MAYRLGGGEAQRLPARAGKSWPPGSFPRTPFDFSRATRYLGNGRHGLFDVWSFKGVGALVSSGLGGGSLIYANVILRKDKRWFTEIERDGVRHWPVTFKELERHYDWPCSRS